MRTQFVIILASILILGLVGTLDDAYAESFTSFANGDWNSAATWRDGMNNPGVPGVADDKSINLAHTVTISNPVTNSGLISLGGTLKIDSTLTNNGFFDGVTTKGIVSFGGTINVTSNGIVQNNGLYDNLSGSATTIDFGGQFFNNFASGHGAFHNEDSTVNVKGSFTNFGDVHQLTDGILTISTINYKNSGSNAVFDNRFGAEIRLEPVGNLSNELGATIKNAGIIDILNLSALSILSDGVVNNTVTGIINIKETSSSFTNFEGIINNEGEIINMGDFENLDVLNNKSTGFINNTKTLKNDAFFAKFNNEGNIENYDTFANEGTINNNSTGTIENYRFLNNNPDSTLNNEGILDNYHIVDNDGTFNNKEDATLTNFDGGEINNFAEMNNEGKITNMDTFTNDGTLNNDNYFENEGIFDNISGTINNTCLINNSGSVPNMGGDLNNQNIINNTGMLAVQPGGTFSNTGTLIGNMEVNILEDEIIPEDDKIKGRIVVVTPDRLAKNTDKVGQLPLKGAKMTFSHSGSPIMQDSDRTDGNFSFDVPTKKDTVSLETILKDGASMGFPDGLFEVHHAVKGTPVKFKTENFNSCIRIAFLELSFDSPEFKLSGKDSTPTLTGLAISDVDRLADLAAIYYYTFIGFDFLSTHVPEVTVDKIPLLVIGYSTESKTNNSNFFTNTTPPTIDIGTDDGTLVLGAFSRGKHTETQFDVLYHEFGHYITYESKISGENSNVNKVANVHPLLAGVPDFGGCHVGYANQESSCAFDEGFASFVGAVIQEKMLTDTKHKPKFDADVFKSRAGDSFLNNDLYDVFGERVGGVKIFRPLYEEFAVSSLLWALYSPNWINTVSNDFNALMGVFGIPSLNDISDLYATMKNSGLVSNADLDMIFGLYKICIDANNNFNCDVSEVHGETAWKNVKRSAILFSYPIPGSMINRTDLPPYLPSLVSFDVEDLTGNTIMDGTEVIIETISAGGEIFSYTSIVYDGKLTTNFLMAEGSHTNLIFSNDDYFSESITITQEQYFNGFVDEDVLNSLGFTVKMNQRDSCIPPMSGDWTISASCELIENTIAPGNVTITNTSVMEILSGKTLTITSGNNITIEKDSGLSIIANGTLQINS